MLQDLIGLDYPGRQPRRLTVEEALSSGSPADRFGSEELRIVGWYASLDADCTEPPGQPAVSVPWLELVCPLRVLVPVQPLEDVSQSQLEGMGLRLSAATGQPVPSRSGPGGPNLRGEQLVFVGHFDDPAAAQCAAPLREQCRDTFVVSDYEGLVR